MTRFTATTKQLLMLGASVALSAPAMAQQAYPNKPIRFIIPNAPGGSNTVVARMLGEKLTESWGQQVIVDNRPGGNNVIAAEAMLRSPADGQTILLVTAAHAINPTLIPNQPYDAIKDFAPVAALVSTQYILAVNAALPAKNLKEFIALAKARPGQLNGAVSNTGGIQHLALELFNAVAGVKVQYVPYKGGGPGMTDLIGGHVEFAFNNSITFMPHIKSGKIRPLAVSGDTRLTVFPQIPTFAEAGLPAYGAQNWFGVVAPAATPKGVIDKLAGEIARIQGMSDFREKLAAQGVEPFIAGPAQFAALIKSDMDKYARIIKAANIKHEQ